MTPWGKANYRDSNRISVALGSLENRQSDPQGRESVMYGTVMMGTGHCTFVKTYRIVQHKG